jgi:conjugative relaxase-like TrwC/TraI family protein
MLAILFKFFDFLALLPQTYVTLADVGYRHDISRDKDPQLHTHAAILNATFGGNGELRSLDSPAISTS